jgi:hypothetical protein
VLPSQYPDALASLDVEWDSTESTRKNTLRKRNLLSVRGISATRCGQSGYPE